jgi:hypothetical protein
VNGVEIERPNPAQSARQHLSSKLLKKKKKLKELEKNNMELFKKMGGEKERRTDRFDNKAASIYKTL